MSELRKLEEVLAKEKQKFDRVCEEFSKAKQQLQESCRHDDFIYGVVFPGVWCARCGKWLPEAKPT
jgi:hypothetical protein